MNGLVCQSIPTDLAFLTKAGALETKPLAIGTFDSLEQAQEGCITALNEQEVDNACCMYIQWEIEGVTDFDMMLIDVDQLDQTIIEPMDIQEGAFIGSKVTVHSELVGEATLPDY